VATKHKLSADYSGFQSSFIDFRRGIRVGRLDRWERITQILKALLVSRHGVEMVCDRWGRGVYWQWICWVPKPNRDAKPVSSAYNFSSVKFFVAVDREDLVFQSGMQIERAPIKPGKDDWGVKVQRDWDWHVMLKALGQDALPRAIRRLLREGFRVRVGPFSELREYSAKTWDAAACRRIAQRFAAHEWGGLQLFWPMPASEVESASGADIIQAVTAVFDEVAPAMNLCMYAPCLKSGATKR
jgi:hypothetical protein